MDEVVDKMNVEEEIYNQEHWDDTYNKMVLKQGMAEKDKEELWRIKEVQKESIIEELMSGKYEWSTPSKAEIAKSESKKKRVVYIYDVKDRYLLGVLYRVLSECLSSQISDRCYSYKKGENTSNAIRYIRENRKDEQKFGVKVDIHAYFNSVSRERVEELIESNFEGGIKETLRRLMLDDKIIWKGKEIEEWKALIPGSAIGSLFANLCLSDCDRYFESKDCIYARYSDDIIVIESDKDELKKDLDVIMEYLSMYGLTMNPDKYTWFEPGDDVEYLGLKLMDNGKIDISDHAKKKIKKQIHRWCRKSRVLIEKKESYFMKEAKKINRQLNSKNFKCYIKNEATFGWCHYAFRYIDTIESLKEIDFYTRDTLKAMKTGKHNKKNDHIISDQEFKDMGWVSLVDLYMLYKEDFDYYCEIIELI